MFVLDTTVFVLTVIRTMQMRHTMQTQAILVILFRDGGSRLQLYSYVCLIQAGYSGTLYYLYVSFRNSARSSFLPRSQGSRRCARGQYRDFYCECPDAFLHFRVV